MDYCFDMPEGEKLKSPSEMLLVEDGVNDIGDCRMTVHNYHGDIDEWETRDGIHFPVSWVRHYEAYSSKTTLLKTGGYIIEELNRGIYSKTEYSNGVITIRAEGKAEHFESEIAAAFGVNWTKNLSVLLGGYDSNGVPYFQDPPFGASHTKDGKHYIGTEHDEFTLDSISLQEVKDDGSLGSNIIEDFDDNGWTNSDKRNEK